MSEQRVYVVAHREIEPRWKTRDVPQSSPYVSPPDYYKIGIGENLKQRLKNLSVGTPHKLELITTIESDNPKLLESKLHSLFFHLHQNGEWYHLTINPINSLKALDHISEWEIRKLTEVQHYRITDPGSLYTEIMKWRNYNE